jgi:hypothetical protein
MTDPAEAFLHNHVRRACQMLFIDDGAHDMRNLLTLACVAALMSACAGFAGSNDGGNGAVVAAVLGFHGPLQASGNDGN